VLVNEILSKIDTLSRSAVQMNNITEKKYWDNFWSRLLLPCREAVAQFKILPRYDKKALGKNAKMRFDNLFTDKIAIKRYGELYEQLIEEMPL